MVVSWWIVFFFVSSVKGPLKSLECESLMEAITATTIPLGQADQINYSTLISIIPLSL